MITSDGLGMIRGMMISLTQKELSLQNIWNDHVCVGYVNNYE
jgi:hypothetical protein